VSSPSAGTQPVGADAGRHPSTGHALAPGHPISGRPPERLLGGVVELRRHDIGDRTALVAAVNRSLDELRPWMPWAQVPATDESIGTFLERSRRAWDAGMEFGYSMRAAKGPDDEIVGACGLHLRSQPGVAEIGYWVRSDCTRAGVATAAARALTEAARALSELERVEIHCDGANVASRAVPPKIGYRLDRVDRRPPAPRMPGETDELMIWVDGG
jgi:RimJ/RimL family protein N-acetyltransferase